MSDYRYKTEKKSPWMSPWYIILMLFAIILFVSFGGFVLKSFFLVGDTMVERKVFEHSYQRQESIKSEIAVNEASLDEINHQLSNPNLDVNVRNSLEAQAAAIRVRVNAAKRRLK